MLHVGEDVGGVAEEAGGGGFVVGDSGEWFWEEVAVE